MCDLENCTEDIFSEPIVYASYSERIVYAAITSFICITGSFGNTLVILAVFVSKKLRNKTNTFVVNLAVADLVSCMNLPWMALAILCVDHWPLPSWICMWEGMCLMVSTGCSLYTLGGIALSRACLITLPTHRFHEMLTTKTLTVLVAAFWMIPVAVAATPFAVSYHFFGFNPRYSMCIWNTTHPFSPTYNLVIATSLYPIPLVIIFASYIRIWRHVRVHSRRMARVTAQIVSVSAGIGGAPRPRNVFSARQMSVTKNLFLIIVVFLLLTSPYTILLVIPGGERLVPALAMIFLFNSCVNPFIYGTRHPDFKVAFRNILRCPTMSNQPMESTSSVDDQNPQRNQPNVRRFMGHRERKLSNIKPPWTAASA
ncbi:melatonin receptor type 1B-B-like [Diadema antillarum]|uniref:melatonin receptor type 1B-B-like n=1 Tax=Diadema antillarum TaxID=105358 RepID=UPI003A88F04C